MNKQEVLPLNVVPDGKEPWLSYDEYLVRLFALFSTPKAPRAPNRRETLFLPMVT